MSEETTTAEDSMNPGLVIGSVVAGGLLLSAALYGVSEYKRRKVIAVANEKSNCIPVKRALAQAAATLKIPSGTYIATDPVELARISKKLSLDMDNDTGRYWMQPLGAPDSKGRRVYKGAVINAPRDAAGTVDYAGLLHEIGHAIDYSRGPAWRETRHPFLNAVKDTFVGVVAPDWTPTLKLESRAWDNAGFKPGHRQREAALDTYRFYERARLLRYLMNPWNIVDDITGS